MKNPPKKNSSSEKPQEKHPKNFYSSFMAIKKLKLSSRKNSTIFVYPENRWKIQVENSIQLQ
jgi:hypothetical protein